MASMFFSILLILCIASYNVAALRVGRYVSRTLSRLTNTALLDSATTAVDKDICGPCPLAPKCNGEYKDQGCDGSGKIQGGIALYLKWWPIKVFRPCPAYLQAGYQYRREGQTLDQVLFSEPSTKMKEKMEEMRRTERDKANELKQIEGAVGANSSDDESTPRREPIQIDAEAEKLLNEKFGSTDE
mmetsp:Transcript_8651/g.14398  ORF Transcript_8651/g.14398 Transcript_8651/m.14398 type:complete len:186 (-) Transcript_8651:175-732(-)